MNESFTQKKLDVIQDISKALSASLDLDTLLSLIMSKVTQLMTASRSTLFLLSDDKNHLWSKVLKGGELVEIRLKVGQGIAGWVAESGESVNIVDAYSDVRFDRQVDKESGFKTETILCVPMRESSGNTIGVLQLLNKEEGAFSEEDEELLEALSSQAAMAIENSKLYHSVVSKNNELARAKEHLKKRNDELDLLFRLERTLGTNRSEGELFEAVVRLTSMQLGAAHAFVCTWVGADKDVLECFMGKRGQKSYRLNLEEYGSLRKGLLKHETVELETNDFTLPADMFNTIRPTGVKNLLLTPVEGVKEKNSFLVLVNKSQNGKTITFTEEDKKIVAMIAGQVGHALDALEEQKVKEEEDRLSVIGQMLASVVHDLKTPMTIISGYAQLMAQEDDLSVRNEYQEEILGQFDMLSGMTGSVLAFARGDSEQLVSKVYLDKFFKKLLKQLQSTLDGKSIELNADFQYQGMVHMDERKVLRMIHNLVRNAEQAMEGKGCIELRSVLIDKKWHFVCKDNGPGIPLELRESLFERFASGKEDGTGLGLAICKKVCESHNGSIHCDTHEGAGAVFRFALPIGHKMPTSKAG